MMRARFVVDLAKVEEIKGNQNIDEERAKQIALVVEIFTLAKE